MSFKNSRYSRQSNSTSLPGIIQSDKRFKNSVCLTYRDFYKDDKNGITKIGYRFIFQSNEKTLTLGEVDVAIKKVVESIISDDEIEVPGYS